MATLTGADVGRAHLATRAALERVVARGGLGFHDWVVLTNLAQAGGRLPRAELVGRLGALQLPGDGVAWLLDGLVARGVLTAGDETAFTAEGAALRDELAPRVAELTARVWDGLDEADLAAAHRVLSAVTARANAAA